MMKTLFSVVLFFVLVGFTGWVYTVQLVKIVNGVSTENMENLKLEKNSDMDLGENMEPELKKFYAHQDILCESESKKYENLKQTVHNYVQRYVSLFLITSNLLAHEIKDLDEEITIDLEISVTGRDLAYLQDHSKGPKDIDNVINLSKLDTIFSKIARLKERSYMENAMMSSKSFFDNINIFSIFSNPSFYHNFFNSLYFITIFILSWICINHSLIRSSFPVMVVIFINSSILWEGLNLYWKKIKEINTENYLNMIQMEKIPAECDPANIRWYHRITSFFLKDRCLEYHQVMAKDTAEEVSLLQCIIDKYSFYLVTKPIHLFGTSVRELSDIFSASLPWPLNHLAKIPLGLIFALFGGFFILIYGKRLRLSFFGAALEIEDSETVPKREYILSSNEKPRGSRVIRKLKPWTKSRFPKRLDGDFGKRRKLFSKAFKSSNEITDQNVRFEQSNGDNLLSTEIKYY